MDVKVFKKYWFQILLALIFLLGFWLRLKGFIHNSSFWHDECTLGWNVFHKGYLELFGKLRFGQVCPPMILVISKFLVGVFQVKNNPFLFEMVLRIVPFVFGVASLVIFPFLLNTVFKKKASIIFAYILFATNQALVYYSYEFKQYSCDVFITLAVLLFFMKIDKITVKKAIIAGCIMAFGIWFSFISVIAIGAGFIVLLLRKKFDKKLLFIFVPILISSILYLDLYIINTYSTTYDNMHKFWAITFISKNLSNLGQIILANFMYFFVPFKYYLFLLIFAAWGIFVLLKKDFYKALILILPVFFTMVASWVQVYPFYGRVILFLFPICIIFVAAPFELLSLKKKVLSSFFVLFMVYLFLANVVCNLSYATLSKSMSRDSHPRELFQYMSKNISPDDGIFVIDPSVVDYFYYDSFYNVKNKFVRGSRDNKLDDGYKAMLQSLDGYYWFYISYDAFLTPIVPDLLPYLNKNFTVIRNYSVGQSYLLYAKMK